VNAQVLSLPMRAPTSSTSAIAIVPVRDGVVPAGGFEVVAEVAGTVVLIGSGTLVAADTLASVAVDVACCEVGAFAPGRWAGALATLSTVRDAEVVVLPASPDGRDLAPRLAAALGRSLLAGAVSVSERHVVVARQGGLLLEEHAVDHAVVVTLEPGVRGVSAAEAEHRGAPTVRSTDLVVDATISDVEVVAVLDADAATMDLAEAPRILAGGAGLDSADRFTQLASVAATLDASTGATRVITDRGWVGHARQIGTTGVTVSPKLYLAFGISGAVQHTSGLGDPEHIISVNTDAHCPMMSMADLAIVSDANAVLDALVARLTAAVVAP
jgi:electron transfer flavoprotein alpha subunit